MLIKKLEVEWGDYTTSIAIEFLNLWLKFEFIDRLISPLGYLVAKTKSLLYIYEAVLGGSSYLN